VEVFHFLIYHGIVKNSEVPFLSPAPAPEYAEIVAFTLLIFHNPAAKRARHAAKGGITPRSGVGASSACAPGAEPEKFSLFDLSRDCYKFRSSVPFTRPCAGIHQDRRFHQADFSQSRAKTRPACRFAASPREAGSAQAPLACRARNVEVFHFLIHHGIRRKVSLPPLPQPIFIPYLCEKKRMSRC
jgi:hypothetical protein